MLTRQLKRALVEALRCASTDESRPLIRGIALDLSDGKSHHIVATDGRHLYTANSFKLPIAQPAILAAFWSWKGLNALADAGDFVGCVKKWNGGTNGLADRKARMAGNDPIIQRLTNMATIMPRLEA